MKLTRKNKKRVVIMLALVVLLAVFVIIYKEFSAPTASGVIETPAPAVAAGPAGPQLRPKAFTGTNASFNYPDMMTPLAADPVRPPILEIINFGYRDIQSWRLAVTIQTTQDGLLSGASSYNLRKLHPEQYELSTRTVNGRSFSIMRDRSAAGFSQVAYSLNGRRIAQISLYGDDQSGTEVLQRAFDMVLTSWRWN